MKEITKFKYTPYIMISHTAIYCIVYRPYHLQNSVILRFYTQSAAVFTRVDFKIVP